METLENTQPTENVQPVLLEIPPTTESGVKPESGSQGEGMVRLRQPQRNQLAMMPQCVDDLVPADHPVRMVMAVDGRGEDVVAVG